MGSFDSVANLISDMGTGLSSIFQNPNALYAAYFIAFFGIVYWIIYIGLSYAPANFKGKPQKVMSIMISIIVVGSVFYRYRSIEELLAAMGGFIGTLFIFVIGIAIAVLGVMIIKNNKIDIKHKVAKVALASLCFYVASSIILPLFGFVSNFGGNVIAAGQNVWFYEVVITRFQALRVVGDMLAYIQMISAMVLIFSVLWLPFSLIKGSVSEGGIKPVNPKNKDIPKARYAINRLNQRIKEIDGIFNKMKKIFGGS